MNDTMKSTSIFTPNEFPAWTYVEREQDFERQVLNGLKTPNIIVSVSGPSKSGKSVLLQKVVGKDNLIHIFGPQIKSPEGLWEAVLDWMGVPTATSDQTTTTSTRTSAIGGQGTLGLPGIGSIGANTGSTDASATTGAHSSSYGRSGLKQVEREISNSDFVVFVDDFHYMERPLQVEVAKHLKAAAELGIKICTASVPHRSDDVVRANAELRGRVQAVDMEYWSQSELVQIGRGFQRLNMGLNAEFIQRLALEACGSPQLMQSLCLQTCFRLNVFEECPTLRAFNPGDDEARRILEATSTLTDFSTVVEAMHVGPKLRGQDRNKFPFKDGTTGDVYRAVLLSLAGDPPVMSVPYNELLVRVANVLADHNKSPVGSSVSEACSQIDKIAKKSVEAETGVQGLPPIEWDTTADVENLHVAEPYFLFYLRASPKLSRLGKAA